jgi:Uma2 family endonuclease
VAKPTRQEMTVVEFFAWCQTQDERYELVDGFPVRLRGEFGVSTAHDRIASNIIGMIGGQLRGSPCWPTTSDTALRTSTMRVRRPDVTIECAPPDLKSYEARNPIAAFEILSPATEITDILVKLPEYMRHPKLRTIVIVVLEPRSAVVYSRNEGDQWDADERRDLANFIGIAGTDATLSLADIYHGVTGDQGPAN